MVTIKFKVPRGMIKNPNMRQAMKNAGEFVRDLWLARVPRKSGAYAKGLQHPQSVQIKDGEISVTNHCPHAKHVEHGFKSYNIGLRILANGRGVKVSKEGYRYKIVKMPEGRDEKATLIDKTKQVISSFRRTIPAKLQSKLSHKTYERPKSLHAALNKKIKSKKRTHGLLVISEKAIKKDPTKWRMPARAGQHIGREVHAEAEIHVRDALAAAWRAEIERQQKQGRTPAIRGAKKPITQVRAKKMFVKVPMKKVGTR